MEFMYIFNIVLIFNMADLVIIYMNYLQLLINQAFSEDDN